MGNTNNKDINIISSKKDIEKKIELAKKTNRLQLSNVKPKLKIIPNKIINELINLKSLDISNNDIEILDLGKLTKLNNLNINNNKIKSLPYEISNNEDLKTLNANNNELTTVEGIKFKKLIHIDLSYNKFDGEIGHPYLALPKSIVKINLSHNKIESLSLSFGFEMLIKLNELDLSFNNIEEIPDEISYLKNLQVLKLNNNKIKTLPPNLFKNTRLSRLSLENNLITKDDLLKIKYFDLFLERRKQRISKEISGGLKTSLQLCGLD